MKLLRYGAAGAEKPGILDSAGRIRSLAALIADITPESLGVESMRKLAAVKTEDLPLVEGAPRLGPPVRAPGKFIAIGLNFRDHAAETGQAIPKEPIIFSKAVSCIVGANDPVMIPKNSRKTDWEVELGLVMGTRASYVSEADALSHVAGYCVVNDVSERAFQVERGGTWDKGKGCDTFGPVGPYLVTPEEVGNPQDLNMWLDVNGVRRQTGNTRTMIFPVGALVSYISQFMTLHPGDIVTTGTPPGVGTAMKPPVYLKPGDSMTLGVEKLGQQQQTVIAWTPQA